MVGCIPVALSPFYQEADLVSDPALVGLWRDKPDSKESWKFEAGKDKAYRLTITEEEGASPFVAHLFQINGQRFLDLFPDDSAMNDMKQASLYKFSLIPGHLLLRVKQIEPSLQSQVLDYDWLKKFLHEHPTALAHQYVGENSDHARLVFTGPTAQLQQFIKQQLNNPDAWSKSDTDGLHQEAKGNGPGKKR